MGRRAKSFCKNRPWIALTIAIVMPSVLASLIEYFMTDGISGLTPVMAAIAGGLIAGIILYFIRDDESFNRSEGTSISNAEQVEASQTPDAPNQSILPNPRAEERVLSRRTPAELIEELSGMTQLSAEHYSSRHLGQWLRIDGPVENVSRSAGDICLTTRDTESQVLLSLRFNEDRWGATLSSFNIGDRFSAIGRIRSVYPKGGITLNGLISLGECELVD